MEKHNLIVEPGRGVGQVDLGMPRSRVHQLVGQPEGAHSLEYHGALSIEYDALSLVQFLEVSHVPGRRVQLYDLFPFEVSMEELVECLKLRGKCVDSEGGCSFHFPDLGLALWRSTRPGPDDLASGSSLANVQGWSAMTVAIAVPDYW
jgi:hypothetical protein